MTQTTWSDGPSSGRAAPGTTIGGRYELRAAVGTGGMGTVWRATDTLLRRDVAVKEVVLPPGLAPSDRDAMYERTMREARAAAALSHPAVVQVYDVVTEGGRPWIVMELLDARSLADMVIEDGPLAPRAVAKIGIALLGALEVAHAAGVLHRDVKPANVLICSDGRCVLTDFGVARMPTDVQLTTPGMVLGSPHFISPERAMGGPFGPPSDLFSLGVTLYTAVEGRPPFDKGDPIETMHAVVEEPPTPPVRAGALSTVLFGLMEKDPARRWNVPAARAALRELLAGPLASSSPQFITDPYAVVPAQRAGEPAPARQPAPSGQVGGRAMLAPGESPADRLAQRSPAGSRAAGLDTTTAAGGLPTADGATTAAGLPAAGTTAAAGAPSAPAGSPASAANGFPASGAGYPPPGAGYPPPAFPAPNGAFPPPGAGYPPPGAGYPPPGVGFPPPAGSGLPPGQGFPGTPPGPGWPQQPQYGGLGPAPGQGWPLPQPAGGLLERARRTGAGLAGRVRSWPRRTKLVAAGGLAVVLVLGTVALLNMGGSPERAQPVAQSSQPPADQPSFSVQQYSGRGISVNVPAGWQKKAPAKAVYVDYTDPDDPQRRVRILVEKTGGDDPAKFLSVAGDRLDRNASGSCDQPYHELNLAADVQLDGQPAAELEYTCGEGDEQRHGIWRAVIQDGHAYSFYLTVSESRFEESKPIYDEMVRTFKLNPA
ncbi:MAG: protein kinase [Micromonosporaceae bacterium]|nr:protein kinase [Micromonosporaceae bacterium]